MEETPYKALVETQASSKSAIDDKLPPSDEEAEAAALGSMLISEEAAGRLVSMLHERDFYNPLHREVFKAMLAVSHAMKQIDVVTVKSELLARGTLDKVGGTEFLIQLAESVPSAANSEYYAQIVIDMAVLRGLQAAGHDIVKIVHDPELDVQQKVDRSERCVFDVAQRRLGRDFVRLGDAANELFHHELVPSYESGQAPHGLTTGFSSLDSVLTGFYPGNLIILAARPAVGKTSLALAFAMNAAKETGGTVVIFSMEMSMMEVARRIICTEAKVDSSVLRRPNLPHSVADDLASAVNSVEKLNVYVDDTGDLSPFEMRAKCRRLQAVTGDLSLVVVDYLQLMRPPSKAENRTQQISEIARSLKNFAKELDVPIVALSQLSRGVEHRRDKRPLMSDLRESGSIEADADVVMLMYREDYYKRGEAKPEDLEDDAPIQPVDPTKPVAVEVHIAKNRNGATAVKVLHFTPAHTRFTVPDTIHE